MKDVWEQNVLQAKTLAGNKRKTQMKIAALAIEACEIQHGGNRKQGYKFKSVRTITNFAKEIGVAPRTLQNWVLVYRRVYKHVPVNMVNKISYKGLEYVSQKLPKFSSSELVVQKVSQYIKYNRAEHLIITYAETLRSLVNNLFVHKVPNVDEGTLSEIGGWFQLGLERLEDMGIKPKQLDQSRHQQYITNGFSLNEYDNKIVSILKKGQRTSGQLIKESGLDKNRVLRSVRKLNIAGVISKNKHQYEVKGSI